MIDPILQYKYVSLVGDHLEGFKRLRENVYNFRCPICGDSEKKVTKKRGYLLHKNGEFMFYCHNCGLSMPLKKFIKEVDENLYKQFKLDMLHSGTIKFSSAKEKEEPEIHVEKWEIKKTNLKSIDELDKTHPAYVYLKNRNVPEEKFHCVKWTDNFRELVDSTIGDKYKEVKLPEKGIVFELRDFDGKVTGYQIRSIEKNCPKSQRFVICDINEEHGFFYDKLDFNKQIIVVEGCTDSLFLDNCVAVLSSTLWRIHPSDNCIYINDNEPRNSAVCKQIEKCISKGYTVSLLPREFDTMDINDIVNSGYSYKDLPSLINRYAFKGLKAKIEFAKWRK